MNTFVEVVVVAFASFASTSTDNLLLLVVLLGQSGQRRAPVMAGYVVAATVIAIVGLVISQLADALPASLLGLLGVIPLGLGLVRLARAIRSGPTHDLARANRPALGVVAVALLMLANGADTVAVLAPLFAETSDPFALVIAATVIAAAVGWVGLASAIGRHPGIRAAIAPLERWLVPLLLIGIGAYILSDTASDVV